MINNADNTSSHKTTTSEMYYSITKKIRSESIENKDIMRNNNENEKKLDNLFVLYLTIVSVAHSVDLIASQDTIVNELESIWKEAVVA